MMILLSLVCAIQACLTLWLYRKVTCMQAGILIANLGSRAELEELTTRLEELSTTFHSYNKAMQNMQQFHVHDEARQYPAFLCLGCVKKERSKPWHDYLIDVNSCGEALCDYCAEVYFTFEHEETTAAEPDTSAMSIVIIGQEGAPSVNRPPR